MQYVGQQASSASSVPSASSAPSAPSAPRCLQELHFKHSVGMSRVVYNIIGRRCAGGAATFCFFITIKVESVLNAIYGGCYILWPTPILFRRALYICNFSCYSNAFLYLRHVIIISFYSLMLDQHEFSFHDSHRACFMMGR